MTSKRVYTAVLVGCGSITKAWMPGLTEGGRVRFVGLADLDPERANALKEEWNLEDAKIFTDFAEAIDTCRPEIVLDCTVPSVHHLVTLHALERGAHVLGEKPMSDSLKNARAMTTAATDSLYAVIQNRRYQKGIIRLKRFLESGAIGTLTGLDADFYLGAHFEGFRAEMQHVLLMDMAIHTFDQARYLSGADPVSVLASDWNPKGSWYRHGANAAALFTMTEGIRFNYRGSWCVEGHNTSWQGSWRILGTKGTVLWDGEDDIRAETAGPEEGLIRKAVEVEVPEIPDPEATGHRGVFQDFFTALDIGTEPQTVCTDNLKSLAMVHAACESAACEAKVAVEYALPAYA